MNMSLIFAALGGAAAMLLVVSCAQLALALAERRAMRKRRLRL